MTQFHVWCACAAVQVEPGAVQSTRRDAPAGDHHHAAREPISPGPPAARDLARRLPGRQVLRKDAPRGRIRTTHQVRARE